MPKVTAGDHRAEVHRPRDHSSPVKVRGYPSAENGNFQKCLLADGGWKEQECLQWYTNLEPEAESGKPRVCQGHSFRLHPHPQGPA